MSLRSRMWLVAVIGLHLADALEKHSTKDVAKRLVFIDNAGSTSFKDSAKIVPSALVTPETAGAADTGKVAPQISPGGHAAQFCSASFAGGLTVGVVGTLLIFSVARERSGKTPLDREPQLQQSEPAEGGNPIPRRTDSVESIHRFVPRCGFLVAMLLVQSLSSLMLAGFQDLIQSHPSIVFFLTMVVGTGGNVGGQSVVLAVRRLAYGEEVSIYEQFIVGLQLAAVLAPLALLRAYAQGTKLAVCLTIGCATVLIVVTAAALGTALPKLLNQIKVDPAHATPVIQVLMDMVGVLVTCVIGFVVLDMMLKTPSM